MKTEFRYGQKIQQLRDAKPGTQEQLAAAAELDVRTIQRAEKDITKNPETLQAIAGALNADADIESIRSKWLIPEAKLANTWLVTNRKEFFKVELTRPAHQFARLTFTPLTEESQREVDELLRQIFADRDLIEPYDTDLWGHYEEQTQELLQSLFDMELAFFVMDERKDVILPDLGHLKPTKRCIDNWRVLYYLVVPRHGCFQVGEASPLHRFNQTCEDSGQTIFRAIKQSDGGALVYGNALHAVVQAGGEDRIQWCNTCFPQRSDGQRISLEYIAQVTGREAAEIYADYQESSGHPFIQGLS